MRRITHKCDTLRRAVAEAIVIMDKDVLERVQTNDLPKKDVLSVARVAGMMAAKKTSELIPYCHTLPVDFVDIIYEWQDNRIRIEAVVEAVWRTGVEMEALTAASITALTMYDMLKPLGQYVEISSIRLVSKEGGKSDFNEKIPKSFQAAVIVTSNGTFKKTREDRSGRIIQERLESLGIPSSYTILPDDLELIAAKIKTFCEQGIPLIVTTGGTGLGPQDVTVEATKCVMDREIPGIMETARVYGQKRTPYAMLSRGIVGQKGKTLIVNLPGSSKGVMETLDAIFPAILHAYRMMRGEGHPQTSASNRIS